MYALIKVKIENYRIDEEPTIDVQILATGGDKQALLKQMIDAVGNFCGWDQLEDFYRECRDEIDDFIRNGYAEVVTDFEEEGSTRYWTVKEL